jgi:hypothetical protein
MAAINKTGVLELRSGESWKKVVATLDGEMLQLTDLTSLNPDDVANGTAGLGNEHQPGTNTVHRLSDKVRTVRIRKVKSAEGLGISVKGGAEANLPIIVAKIFPGLAADRCNKLFVGDEILAVNGRDLVGCTHDDAVQLLKTCGDVVELSVRYVKDAGSLFRQAAEFHRLSGEFNNGAVTYLKEPPKVHSPDAFVTIPMKFCYIARGVATTPEDAGKSIDVFWPLGELACTLRCTSPKHTDDWLMALLNNVAHQMYYAMDEANEYLSSHRTPHEVRMMGWLSEQPSNPQTRWKPVFVAVTDHNILMFNGKAPTREEDWDTPTQSLSLLATRVVHQGSSVVFAIRTGSSTGIESHTFKTENDIELSRWKKALVQGSQHAAALVKEIKCSKKPTQKGINRYTDEHIQISKMDKLMIITACLRHLQYKLLTYKFI